MLLIVNGAFEVALAEQNIVVPVEFNVDEGLFNRFKEQIAAENPQWDHEAVEFAAKVECAKWFADDLEQRKAALAEQASTTEATETTEASTDETVVAGADIDVGAGSGTDSDGAGESKQ
jgi:hypothetical protein